MDDYKGWIVLWDQKHIFGQLKDEKIAEVSKDICFNTCEAIMILHSSTIAANF